MSFGVFGCSTIYKRAAFSRKYPKRSHRVKNIYRTFYFNSRSLYLIVIVLFSSRGVSPGGEENRKETCGSDRRCFCFSALSRLRSRDKSRTVKRVSTTTSWSGSMTSEGRIESMVIKCVFDYHIASLWNLVESLNFFLIFFNNIVFFRRFFSFLTRVRYWQFFFYRYIHEYFFDCNQEVEADYGPTNVRITCIRYNSLSDEDNSAIWIASGGIGHNFVKLKFRSKYSRGFHYRVFVYGQPLRSSLSRWLFSFANLIVFNLLSHSYRLLIYLWVLFNIVIRYISIKNFKL